MADDLLASREPAEPQIQADAVPPAAEETPEDAPVAPQRATRRTRAPSDPDAVREAFETGRYPYRTRMSRRQYEAEKALLQAELLKVQIWAQDTGQKFVILFEGRDAAGKGGTSKRFNEHLNPRAARVVALNKPTDEERGQWYFQRYVRHLPTSGEMVFYDRSWYNRAGVERVMGFCSATITWNSCARRRNSNGCWCGPASGFTNTGSRSRRTNSARGSRRARPTR